MPNIIKNHHLDMNSSLQEKQFAVESLNVLNLSEVAAVNYTLCECRWLRRPPKWIIRRRALRSRSERLVGEKFVPSRPASFGG